MTKSLTGFPLLVTAGLFAASGASALETQNGSNLNGLAFNGLAFNGLAFNGLAFNGLLFNGLAFNGATETGAAAATDGVQATTVILKDGTRVTLQ